ncbi:MAG: hypothetical protein JNL82_19180 [Myxococcales bacterium]|nr:hypothetical protein [Myxococcales bacterium]
MGVRIGARGGRWIEVHLAAAVTRDAIRFHDAAHALRLLREHADADDVRRLRELVPGAATSNRRLVDLEVLRRVAERLAAGTLVAVVHAREYPALTSSVTLPPPADVPLVPFTARPEPPTLAPVRARIPEFTPPSDWEPLAQARALVAAAEDGAPFCEVCARTAAERAAGPGKPAAGRGPSAAVHDLSPAVARQAPA